MNAVSERRVAGKSLHDLLHGVQFSNRGRDVLIEDLCLDSRKARPGSLFFAIPGHLRDGRDYMHQALECGASAILYESDGWNIDYPDSQPLFGVRNLRRHIGPVADAFFDKPSSKLHVVGITGTNAKSSCAGLAAQALEKLGNKCGIIGTLGSGFSDNLTQSALTTPDAVTLQREIASLLDDDAQYLCLEVSSHSLDQSRNVGVRFGTVVFTNLSQDHMDYHGSVEHYRASKSKLFTETSASCAVLNIDDAFGRSLLRETSAERKITYGTAPSDIQLLECIADRNGLTATIRVESRKIKVQSDLLGRLNGINLTAVAAVLHALEFDASAIESGLQSLRPVPGRMERIHGSSDKPTVYVDFAHTPDGLENALTSLREITEGELWCVFGCGGNRDVDKRPMMGSIAERLADHIVITDDNPRNESPQAIVRRIVEGMKRKAQVIHDRAEAIRTAIDQANPDDAVLIAGKGHETTQTYGDRVIAFSDRDFTASVLGCKG